MSEAKLSCVGFRASSRQGPTSLVPGSDPLLRWRELRFSSRHSTAGDPASRIIERVLTARRDLVVVAIDQHDEAHATIKRLLRKCPCPVWVIRPTRARMQRVLAAVNADPAEAALNDVLSSRVLARSHGECISAMDRRQRL